MRSALLTWLLPLGIGLLWLVTDAYEWYRHRRVHRQPVMPAKKAT